MTTPARAVVRQVKPLLSLDHSEARRRVLNLYRSWYRQVPYIIMDYDIQKNDVDLRNKIREEFVRHRNVKDIRVIDMLVIKKLDASYTAHRGAARKIFTTYLKGQMELQETVNLWKNKGNLMYWFKDTVEKKPTDFVSKFLAGHD